MARQKAIDIGNDSICAVELAKQGDRWVLRRWAVLPLEETGLLPDDDGKRGLVARKVKDTAKAARIGLSGVAAALPGRSSTVRYMRVPPVPAWRLEMLVRYQATEELVKGTAYAHDHRILALPYAPGQMVVLVGVTQEQAAEDRLSLIREAGGEDVELDLATTAVFNAYNRLHRGVPDKTTLFIDIGAEETHVVIEKNDQLFFARTLTTGSRRITQTLMQEMRLGYQEAERLKRSIGIQQDQAGLDDSRKQAALTLLREVSTLASNVEASIMFAQSQTLQKDLKPQRVVIAGGGAELPGLCEFLSRRFKADVELFKPGANLEIKTKDAPSEAQLRSMALALGLAIGRLDAEGFTLDLLPGKYKRRALFFSRDIYLYYAGAALLAALSLFTYRGVARYLGMKQFVAEEQRIVSQDEMLRRRYDEASQRVAEVEADIHALLDRVYSGEDVLRVLSVLKKKTPPEIYLTKMTVEPEGLAEEEFLRGGTFQETRRLYIRGVAHSGKDDEDAIAKVRSYAGSLRGAESGLFSVVEIVYLEFDEHKVEDTFVKEFVVMLEVGREKKT